MAHLAQQGLDFVIGWRAVQPVLQGLDPPHDLVAQFGDDVVAAVTRQLRRHGLQIAFHQVHFGPSLHPVAHSIFSSEADRPRHSVVSRASMASPRDDRR